MARRLLSTGSTFEEKFAYSRAVVQDNWCFLSGTTGYNYETMKMPKDAAAQTRNIFQTIRGVLGTAGFSLHDIVRLQVTVTDPKHWDASADVVREFMGEVKPANTTVVSDLMTPEMKIEIEATAYRSPRDVR